MENKIRHDGVVESVKGRCVTVRIVQSSACSLCKAASLCHASESKEKLVDAYVADASWWRSGQKVIVVATQNAGFLAVVLAMLLPLLLVALVLAVATALTSSEVVAALAGLSTLIPYYIILYFFRDHVSRKVSFTLESTDENI